MPSVITAGTMLARSSTKSIQPDSIFSFDAGAVDLVDHRLPAGHGGGREVRVERLPVVPLLGRVHLQEAAAEAHAPGVGMEMPL